MVFYTAFREAITLVRPLLPPLIGWFRGEKYEEEEEEEEVVVGEGALVISLRGFLRANPRACVVPGHLAIVNMLCWGMRRSQCTHSSECCAWEARHSSSVNPSDSMHHERLNRPRILFLLPAADGEEEEGDGDEGAPEGGERVLPLAPCITRVWACLELMFAILASEYCDRTSGETGAVVEGGDDDGDDDEEDEDDEEDDDGDDDGEEQGERAVPDSVV